MDFVEFYLGYLLVQEAESIANYQGRHMTPEERDALQIYESRVMFLRDGREHEVHSHAVTWRWWERMIDHSLVQQTDHQLLQHFDITKIGEVPLGDAFTAFVGWFVTIKVNQFVDLTRPGEEQLPDLVGFLTPELLEEAADSLRD